MSEPPKHGRKWRGESPKAEKPYAWFSLAAIEHLLTEGDSHTLAVYTGLCIRESRTRATDKHSFFASENNIARACGMSARRVRKHLDILERLRLVSRIRPKGQDRIDRQSSKWTLNSRLPTGQNVRSEQDETSSPDRTQSYDKTSDIKDNHGPFRTSDESHASASGSPSASRGGRAERSFKIGRKGNMQRYSGKEGQ